MKIGIFIALLVLVASTEVIGQRASSKDRSSRPKNENDATVQVQLDGKPITVIHEETKPLIVSEETSKPVTVVRVETKPATIVKEVSKPITVERGDSRSVTVVHDNQTPDDVEHTHDDELQPAGQASESQSQSNLDDERQQKQQSIEKPIRKPKKLAENVRRKNRPTSTRKPFVRPTKDTDSEREDIEPESSNEDREHDDNDEDETNPKKLIVEGVSRERLPSQRVNSDVRISTLLHAHPLLSSFSRLPWNWKTTFMSAAASISPNTVR